MYKPLKRVQSQIIYDSAEVQVSLTFFKNMFNILFQQKRKNLTTHNPEQRRHFYSRN